MEKRKVKIHDRKWFDACRLFEKQQGYNPKNRRGLKKETIDSYNDYGNIIYAFNYSEIQYLEYPYGVQILIPEKEKDMKFLLNIHFI